MAGNGKGENKVMKPPMRVSTLEIKGERYSTKLPVYDATVLLGEEELKRLMLEETGFWRQAQLFAVGREATTELQMKLWKLEGYMAKGELPRGDEVDAAKAAETKVEKREKVRGVQGQVDATKPPARDVKGGGDRRVSGWQGVRRV